jgi:hypothetical protein
LKQSFFFLCIALLAGTSTAAPPDAKTVESKHVDFTRDVHPILSDKCFACHGPDDKSRMAGLRLDTREGAFAERKNGPVIKAGDAAASRLFIRVSHEKPAMRMPPPASDRVLTPAEIDTLRRWIDQGAKWATHWAYTAPERPEPPPTKNSKWARNPIDQFILSRLERESLHASPEAEKTTLLRRVTFDLTGLPPTIAEVDAFLADKSRDAYEKVVDRLLASPRYGERMAMQWLDLARYADTHGYHIDSHRDMWPWRDWLISALNRNMPFNEFTVEMLAGDLLPDASRDQKIASAFNRNHMINFEGGAIPEEYLNEYIVDRVDTVTTVWMGMTAGCARCHDHKYDPIKQKEFYQLYAFFNRVPEKGLDGRAGNAEPILTLPTPIQAAQVKELETAIKTREKALADNIVEPVQQEWEKIRLYNFPAEPRKGLLAHYPLDGSFADVSGNYRNGRTLSGDVTYGEAQVGEGGGFNGEAHVDLGNTAPFERDQPFSIAGWIRSGGVNPMTIFDKSEGERGYSLTFGESIPLGDLTRGAHLFLNLSASEDNAIRVKSKKRVFGGQWIHLTLTYDGSSKASGINLFVNGKPEMLEALQDNLTSSIRTGAPLEIGDRGRGGPFQGNIDDLRFYDRVLYPAEIDVLAVDQPARGLLFQQASRRSKAEKERLREYFLAHDAPLELRKQFTELTELKLQKKKLDKQIPTVMVMKDSEKPRETHILGRGDYRNIGEKVTAAVPAFLPPLPTDAPQNRLGLAQWLVSGAHPLTARVAVNRFWQMFFGTGIVKTVEDFGSQGELPVHRELLDWLATEFVRTGWDVKAMHRLIVTSAAYRQSSKADPALIERDPENRLLARGPRMRLQAEMIRDTALASSGLLNDEIGGPSVFPGQPKGLWEDIAFGNIYSAQIYTPSEGKDLYRRGMYTFWKRTAPPPVMATFDAPDREKCAARRPVTNTPLQSLALMNDPAFIEAARALAERMISDGGTSSAKRIASGFRRVTARNPASKEMRILQDLARLQLDNYKRRPEDAAKLLEIGSTKSASSAPPGELAAWTMVASAIMNLDEAITKE